MRGLGPSPVQRITRTMLSKSTPLPRTLSSDPHRWNALRKTRRQKQRQERNLEGSAQKEKGNRAINEEQHTTPWEEWTRRADNEIKSCPYPDPCPVPNQLGHVTVQCSDAGLTSKKTHFHSRKTLPYFASNSCARPCSNKVGWGRLTCGLVAVRVGAV